MIRTADERAFLAPGDIPPNRLNVRPGTWGTLAIPRRVVRVGYRLRADDVIVDIPPMLRGNLSRSADDAARYLRWNPGSTLNDSVQRALGITDRKVQLSHHALTNLLARTIVESFAFGGPERGVVVEPLPPQCWYGKPGEDTDISADPAPADVSGKYLVIGKRNVRVGIHYPSRGSGEEYEGGGLSAARTIILLCLSPGHHEVLSSDFQPLPK